MQKIIYFYFIFLLITGCSLSLKVDTLDTLAPDNTKITINNGDPATNSPVVNITLSATDDKGVSAYFLSEESSFSNDDNEWKKVKPAPVKNFSEDVLFTLSSGKGEKTIYAWAKDNTENISRITKASITLQDETAPKVVKNGPTGDGVSLNSGISVSFDEEIDPNSLTADNFLLSISGETPGTILYTINYYPKAVNLEHNEELRANTTYQVTLKKEIKDLSGNNMADDYIWTFTTGKELDKVAPAVTAEAIEVEILTEEDRMAIELLTENDSYIEEFFDDEIIDGAIVDYGINTPTPFLAVGAEPVPPPSWGRSEKTSAMTNFDKNIVIEDGKVTVIVDRSIEGKLYIDNTADGEINPIVKDYTRFTKRQHILEKDEFLKWQITEVTPVNISVEKPTLEIKEVRLIRDGKDDWIMDSWQDYLKIPDQLLFLTPGEDFRLEVTTGDNLSTFVFLHHDGNRDQLFDDGTHGDRKGGDHIFTREYKFSDSYRPGRNRAWVDVIDTRIFEKDAPYNAQGWMIPYLVENINYELQWIRPHQRGLAGIHREWINDKKNRFQNLVKRGIK